MWENVERVRFFLWFLLLYFILGNIVEVVFCEGRLDCEMFWFISYDNSGFIL